MAEESGKFLTPRQKSVVAASIVMLAACVLILIGYAAFVGLQLFVSSFSNVLMPLAIAGMLAMLLKPIVTLAEERLRLSRLKAIVLLFALAFLVVAGIASFLIPVLFEQIQDLITFLPRFFASVKEFTIERFPPLFELLKNTVGEEKLNDSLSQSSDLLKQVLSQSLATLGNASSTLMQFFGQVTAYAVIPVYLFYFLDSNRDYRNDLQGQLTFIKKAWRDDVVFLASEFVKILVAFFRGQIVIGLLLGIILALGFSLVGLKFGIILGLIIGLLNIVPYLGTILGLGSVLPIAYFQPEGGIVLLALCLAVFIIAQLIGDYVLTPRIMGKETGLHPGAIIFSIFFWGTALNGLMGMIMAIPLSAFFIVFWRLLKKRYLPSYAHTS